MRSSPHTHAHPFCHLWVGGYHLACNRIGNRGGNTSHTGIQLLESLLAGNLRAIFQISQPVADDACPLMILITLWKGTPPIGFWKLVLQICNYKTRTARSLPAANLSNGSAARAKTWQFAHFQGLRKFWCAHASWISNSGDPNPRAKKSGFRIRALMSFKLWITRAMMGNTRPTRKGKTGGLTLTQLRVSLESRFNSICSLRSHNKLECRRMQMPPAGWI